MNAADAHRYIRSQWAIEVTLHQIMDVTIQEDAHRSSKDHSGLNMAFARRVAFNTIKSIKPKNSTIKGLLTRFSFNQSNGLKTALGALQVALKP